MNNNQLNIEDVLERFNKIQQELQKTCIEIIETLISCQSFCDNLSEENQELKFNPSPYSSEGQANCNWDEEDF